MDRYDVLRDITVLVGKLNNFAGRLLVAIDGRCGAGKTTLASFLQNKIEATVFHMDDFFLRPEQRTAERLNTPGGNVDRERLESEVLIPLRAGEKTSHISALTVKLSPCRNRFLLNQSRSALLRDPIVVIRPCRNTMIIAFL